MKYGLIGKKLGHSFSAIIHHEFASYDYELKELDLEDFAKFMIEKAFLGINVTIPYKEQVIPYLDYLDPLAKRIGAVNTIVNQSGRLFGYNTDYYGFKVLINKLQLSLVGKKVLILGTGGTSKTVKAVLEDEGCTNYLFVSRSSKDNAITYEDAITHHCDTSIIINTTPCGMYPNNDDLIIDLDHFNHLEAVIDVIFNPLRTTLLQKAKAKGVKYLNGLYMLVAQAFYASMLFTNQQLDDKLIDEVFNQMQKRKENIVLIGMPSSGKTAIGQEVAKRLNRKFVDLDDLIEAKINSSIKDYFLKHTEDEFRAIESDVIKEVAKLNGLVIATGGGAILKAENVQRLKQNGHLFWLNRGLELLTPTTTRPLSADFETLKKRYMERLPLYEQSCDTIIAANGSIDEVASLVIRSFEK